MSEIIYQSKHSGKKIDDGIDKIDVLSQQMEQKADKITINASSGKVIIGAATIGNDYVSSLGSMYSTGGAVLLHQCEPIESVYGLKATRTATYSPKALVLQSSPATTDTGLFLYEGARKAYTKDEVIEATRSRIATTDKIDISSTLVNGWTNVSVTAPLIVARSGNVVTINGWIKDGTLNKSLPIATVPSDCIPTQARYLTVKKYNSNDTFILFVDIDGKIKQDNNIIWTAGTCFYINVSYPL